MFKPLVEKISVSQLLVLILIFELGSAIVLEIGSGAKQDAWIAVLVATIVGVALAGLLSWLLRQSPGKNLFEIMGELLGRKLSLCFAFLYVEYFLYIAARVTRDFCELMKTIILPETPLEIISISLILVCCYAVYLGIEVVGRTTEIFAPYSLFFLLMITIFFL